MIDRLKRKFAARFGREPEVVSFAPGRVNIIGEHTDYNGGLVLPAAIERGTYILMARRDDDRIRIYSENLQEEDEWMAGEYPRRENFGDYLRGGLLYSGAPPRGLEVMVFSDLPLGGGLSSSASLEVSFALAVNEVFSLGKRRLNLVEIAHRAESEFVGVRCGLMDQFASALSRADHLLLLNTRTLEYQFVPFPRNLVLALVDTGIRRELTSSPYNRRREECFRALEGLKRAFPWVETLSDADEEMLFAARDYIDETAFKRAVHVISENQRVLALVEFLQAGDLCMVEKVMSLAHWSLSQEFEVSLPEIDELVERISSLPYVYGARLTGAGFGGYVIALLLKGKEDELRKALPSSEIIFSRPAEAARVLYSSVEPSEG